MTLLFIHVAATLYMAGLIWFVQVVHYPLMAKVGGEGYRAYQLSHDRLTTWVVGPPMLVEFGTAIWFVVVPPIGVPRWLIYVGLGLVVVNWLSTALLQVPCHKKLEAGFDVAAHRRLVLSNWIRTIAWSVRGGLVLWMIAEV